MSAITELEAVLRGTADADTDGEDIEAFLPGRRTVTFDRPPKRQRVGAAAGDAPHAPRPRPPAPATPEMRHAPAVTQSPPGPPTAGGSSSDDESVPPPPARRKWAPPTAGFSSSDDEEEAPARPADDDTDDGDDALALAAAQEAPAVQPVPPPLPAPPPPPPPAALPPPPPPAPAQTPAQRAFACLESDAKAMGTTPHGFRRMPTLLLAAYRGDAAAVAALPLLFQRREIVIGLGIREERDSRGKVTSRTRLGSRVVRAPVSDFAMQKTPIDDQNALHLAAGPGEERLAFVVAFLDLVGFETGMHLAMERQRDGVSPAWRARQNKHRHVVELYEPLQRGDRASFMAQLDAARRVRSSRHSRRRRGRAHRSWHGGYKRRGAGAAPTARPPRPRTATTAIAHRVGPVIPRRRGALLLGRP